MKLAHRPVVLIIRDGWGINPAGRTGMDKEADATLMARTPVNDALRATCPHATLDPGGEAVGLPAGQMGNSEVGHLNLGAGRIVYQSLTRITKSIRDGEFFDIPEPECTFMISSFGGGEVFRSGCTWTRGAGKIAYFRPGHETFPTYHNPNVLKVIENAVRWAAPALNREVAFGNRKLGWLDEKK